MYLCKLDTVCKCKYICICSAIVLMLRIKKKRSSSYTVNENVIGTSTDISGHDSDESSEDMEETDLTVGRNLHVLQKLL